MPRLSKSQNTAREQIVLISRSAILPEEFARLVLRAMRTVVPSDDSRFFTIDPASRLLNRLLHATSTDGPHRSRWLRSIYLMEMGSVPYFAPNVLMEAGIPAITYLPEQTNSFGLTRGLLERVESRIHWRIFHETETPVGGSMRLIIGSPGRPLGVLDHIRRDGKPPFSASEFGFLRSLIPLISSGLVAALARERAMRTEAPVTGRLPPGVLILDSESNLRFASAAGEAWARLLLDAQTEEHGSLPTAIWAAAAKLRNEFGSPAVLVSTSNGQARVEASLGQAPGEVVIVVSGIEPAPMPAQLSDWALTPMERKVVELLLRGKRNREISAALFVSEHTVEVHLSHVYEKLGIHGRGELLAKLFTEAFLPAFDPR